MDKTDQQICPLCYAIVYKPQWDKHNQWHADRAGDIAGIRDLIKDLRKQVICEECGQPWWSKSADCPRKIWDRHPRAESGTGSVASPFRCPACGQGNFELRIGGQHSGKIICSHCRAIVST